MIEHLFTALLLVSLIIRYVWVHTVTPLLARFSLPFVRKRRPVSFQNDTVLITGGKQLLTKQRTATRLVLRRLAGGCLGRALAIEFAREARCLALLDVQKKPLDDLKHSLQQIYGKEHCRIYTYRCDLR